MRERGNWWGWRVLLGFSIFLWNCGGWSPRFGEGGEIDAVVKGLVEPLGGQVGEEQVSWLGFREGDGKSSPATQLLDEHLISALLRSGVRLATSDGSQRGHWEGEELVPPRLWQEAETAQVMAGRMEVADGWAYLRLFLIDAEEGLLLGTVRRRLAEPQLRELAARASGSEEDGEEERELAADLHLLVLRDEVGMTHPVAVEEGMMLQSGDRLQVRFKVAADCQVYAFLYSSKGVRRDLFGSQLVYSGRWQYGPGRENWVELDEVDQVHTLYFLVGQRLSDEREDLWERLGELIEEGRVDRFTGVELLDGALVEFLQRRAEENVELAVLRGSEGVVSGEVEEFILDDGTALESRAEILSGSQLLVRAVSFGVQ
jgi:hypothetical protein